jgi:hypothetical protein
MKTAIQNLSLASALMVFPTAVIPAVQSPSHVDTLLHSVGESGVQGLVDLQQRPRNSGTRISLLAFGLKDDAKYVSLYYGNHSCVLEPYSASDIIGGIYTANNVGIGFTNGNASDNLKDINSVSVRDATTFNLLACADVHPLH